MNRKGQTATDYLIILAVVIVVALIVVGVMGDIPDIGPEKVGEESNSTLKIADCGDYLIIGLNNSIMQENWDERAKRGETEYGIERYFYKPVKCIDSNCNSTFTAIVVYDNCSIYYLDMTENYGIENV